MPPYYEFPANVFEYDMPITLLKGDEGITQNPVTLTLRLVETSELGIAYANRSVIRLLIANMLKKPEGDGFYGDMTTFRRLFGEYSRKKHLMIIELIGHDFWDGNYGYYGGANGLFITKPSKETTEDWLSGVDDFGTFVKSKDATWNVKGVNGIQICVFLLNIAPILYNPWKPYRVLLSFL